MKLNFKTENGIGILQNPQMIDLGLTDQICFTFSEKNGIIEVNKILKYKLENGRCEIKVKDLLKGTNTIRVICEDKITPCQPICLFNSADKIKCALATSLDTLELINILQTRVIELEKRIVEIEKTNPSDIKEKLNAVIVLTQDLQTRVNELEAGFDPTLI
jgi:hypothetical protein